MDIFLNLFEQLSNSLIKKVTVKDSEKMTHFSLLVCLENDLIVDSDFHYSILPNCTLKEREALLFFGSPTSINLLDKNASFIVFRFIPSEIHIAYHKKGTEFTEDKVLHWSIYRAISLWHQLDQCSPFLNNERYIKNLIENIMIHIHHEAATNGITPIENDIRHQQTANQFMYIRLYKSMPITMKFMSERFQLKSSQVNKRFQKFFGKSLKVLVMRTRLETAQNILYNTDLSIKHVALLCGFCSGDHLRLEFKKRYFMTPRRGYMKMINKDQREQLISEDLPLLEESSKEKFFITYKPLLSVENYISMRLFNLSDEALNVYFHEKNNNKLLIRRLAPKRFCTLTSYPHTRWTIQSKSRTVHYLSPYEESQIAFRIE